MPIPTPTWFRALLLLAGLTGSCRDEHSAASAASAPLAPLDAGYAPDPARALSGYSFGGGVVPWSGARPPQRIVFGELGRTPRTRLYLSFEQGVEAELARQPGTSAVTRGIQADGGRFGQGCRVDAGGLLDVSFSAPAPVEQAWTVEFWLKPAELSERLLCALEPLLLVRCDARGNLGVVHVHGDAPRVGVRSQGALRAGEWNHVGVVLDLDLHTLRVVLNGEASSAAVHPSSVPAAARRFTFGDPGGRAAGPALVLDELRLQARAANTAELIEHWQAAPGPLETLRLVEAQGTAELEVWTSPLTTAVVDAQALWERGVMEHAVADERGLHWAAGHWRQIDTVDPPVARTTHPTVYVGGHQLLVFGGETRDSHVEPMKITDDTWLFDTLEETWTRVATDPTPAGRCHQAAAYSPDHDLVLLAGGLRFDGPKTTRFSDTWVFHVRERRWEERRPGGVDLGAISDCGVVYHAGARRFLVFTGSRILSYDPDLDRWELIPRPEVVDQAGRPAEYSPGGSMSAVYEPCTQRVLLFGGSRFADGKGSDTVFLDDCALYDFAANRTTRIDSGVRPSPRVRPGLAWDQRLARFVLFGGVLGHESERMRDLWTFDPVELRWTQHESSNLPSSRGGYFGMGYDPELERSFLLCGRHSKERFLNESWSLALDESATGRARTLFDRAAFADRTWFAEVDAPAGARVEFRFRPSEDGRRFGAWSEDCPAEPRFVEVEVRLVPGPGSARPSVRAMGFRGPN